MRMGWLGGAALAAMMATTAAAGAGPFDAPSTLPLQAVPFDRIKDTDYQPAFEAAMAAQAREVVAIANDPAAPTFDNTIAALEKSGQMLNRVSLAFYAVVQANTNDTLDKVQEAEAPRLSAHNDDILLNAKLFARIKTLHDQGDRLKLTAEQRQVLGLYYGNFAHNGALLSDPDKVKLRAINAELASLQTAFQQKLVAAAKAGALVVDDKAKLGGLDAAALAAAAAKGKELGQDGKYVLPLQNTTQQPKLASLTDRATRQQLFERSIGRAERGDANDTRATIVRIAQLRADLARLLGYPSYADYALYDQMAKTPAAAQGFLKGLVPALAAEQAREVADINAEIKADGKSFDVQPWDWDYYAGRVKAKRYALDSEALKPYFEITTVLEQGVFYAANQLYGLTFERRTDLPVYHPDVTTYTVYDQDKSVLGIMYFDYWKRDNKSGGAWMSNFVGQSKLLGTKPVIYNVANFAKPAAGQPALITSEDVITMFHEFGHALHGLFANQTYPLVSGTNTARDFVEFPSQFNENWALDPKVLAHYAKDYRTGAPIGADQVAKIKNAAKFNQGYSLGEAAEASMLDLAWHALPAGAPKQDVDAFEAKTLAGLGLDTAHVPPRYRSTYFLHIWGNGYAAGYYAYQWTSMLQADAFSWFQQHGGLTRANGQRFRDLVLSQGHTQDYGVMFRNFYGKDPDVAPMLEQRGLATPAR